MERLLSVSESGLKDSMFSTGPIPSLRVGSRGLGHFIPYMIQEIYWRLEGSMENLNLFPVGKPCSRDAIGHLIFTSWVKMDPESTLCISEGT